MPDFKEAARMLDGTLLATGEKVAVAIDVTDELVERAGRAIHDYACGCDKPWPMNANYDEMARAALVAALQGQEVPNGR